MVKTEFMCDLIKRRKEEDEEKRLTVMESLCENSSCKD